MDVRITVPFIVMFASFCALGIAYGPMYGAVACACIACMYILATKIGKF